MSVEKIVADFETCKKAAEIGLEIKSVFQKHPYPAPTAEEVPLPTVHMQAKTTMTIAYVSFNGLGVFWEYQSNEHLELYINNPNEATARLKMAIWLIENVQEARQWYADNGYLKEVNRERD